MTNLNELMPITQATINGRLQQAVSAKNLHSELKVKRDFSTWIKQRIKKYCFIEGEDFLNEYSPDLVNQRLKNKQYSPDLVKKEKRGRPDKDYLLTINTAKELAMIENNEHGRAIRKYFIKCEEQLKEIAPKIAKKELNKLKARLSAIDYSKEMREALKNYRLAQGKEAKAHHFINEFELINRVVLGTSSKNYRLARDIQGDIRDYFNKETLEQVAYLEKSNVTLLDMGMSYEQRKQELSNLNAGYMRKHFSNLS